jgi:nitroreductase
VLYLDALEATHKRRSVRNYRSTPLSKEIIEKLIDAGRLAVSAVNIQPWEFIAVTRQETRRKIADAADYGKFMAEAPL